MLSPKSQTQAPALRLSFKFLCATFLLSAAGAIAGTWSPLAHAPPAGLNNALLLSDGTVICGDGGQNWYRLTPDSHGGYVNGAWSSIASTRYTRLFFSSQVLTNGNFYVAGVDYGTGVNHADLYKSLTITWPTLQKRESD